MNKVMSEQCYTSETLCGQKLILEVFGEPGAVTKMTLGNRFFIMAKCYPANADNPDLLNWFFDYYHHYACLLSWEELEQGWKCYQKARKQRCDSVNNAFWCYLSGQRIRLIGRKGSVFKWV
ncbi:hypothetical protein AB6D11_02600 [Vibrio splendidus]